MTATPRPHPAARTNAGTAAGTAAGTDAGTGTQDARSRLLAAAGALLETGVPFTEISVETLSAEAGLARTSFYKHFEDKSALLMELAEHVTRVFEDGASRWYRLPPQASRADLTTALRELVDAHIAHRYTMTAVVDAAAYDPEVRAAYQEVIKRRIALMRRSFETQQRDGAISADLRIDQVTPWIAWLTERAPFQLLRNGPDELEAHLDGMTTVIWNTLYDSRPRTR